MDGAARGREEKQQQQAEDGEGQGEGSRPQTPESDASEDSFHTTSGEDPADPMARFGSCYSFIR